MTHKPMRVPTLLTKNNPQRIMQNMDKINNGCISILKNSLKKMDACPKSYQASHLLRPKPLSPPDMNLDPGLEHL